MDFGIHIFPTEHSIQPGELAQHVEERGFDSVWFSEHTHIPVGFLKSDDNRRNLPDHYWQTYDLFVAAALASAAASTIKIGTGVSLILQHHPINMAKAAATLDRISGGRFIFGVGSGWLAAEMAHHGVRYATRYRQINEQIAAIKTLWSEEEPEFHGEYVNFDAIKAHPKPLQKPHPPIIAGGAAGPKSLGFVVDHCDGWMPILGTMDWNGMKEGIKALRRRALEADRNPETIELSVFVWELPEEQTLAEMEEAGLQRVVISLQGSGREEALAQLDALARLNA